MFNFNKLHVEQDRFFISSPQWVVYVLVIIVIVAFGGVGTFAILEVNNIIGWVLVSISLFLLVSTLVMNPNGKSNKEFKGKLIWGAGVNGLFLESREGKISEYDWSRLSKIVLVEKIIYKENINNVNKIYDLDMHGSVTTLGTVCHKNMILFYVDRINPSQTKIGKLVHDHISKDAEAIAKSQCGIATSRLCYFLSKFTHNDLIIERRRELKIV